ncbi:Sortase family protein [Arthrobacter alpinus]|uniref:Sortase family protein n=1 Tax=Arthrobacter alpinus TaxID=656366 RepID=A0A1H5HTD8_9MICC|nr:class F sortase [Arthrobacter alpinus]SEE31074.1 Sortase family protein [Arthrobacter alpinus]
MVFTSSRRGRLMASATAAVLLTSLTFGVAGCGSATAPGSPGTTPAAQSTGSPPAAPSAATKAPPSSISTIPVPAPTQAAPPKIQGEILQESAPVTLSIPDIAVTTNLMALGRDAKGEAEVPPGDAGSPAGWYKYSPTPGELGPSVILGHVNTTTIAEGVFYRLHELTPGETFSVTRADGSVAVFAVDRSEVFKKDAFPTLAVYGNTQRAEIRLITCGGYEPSTGEFTENTVVYGHLLSSHGG